MVGSLRRVRTVWRIRCGDCSRCKAEKSQGHVSRVGGKLGGYG
jgi:hypothetical protein